MNDEHFETLENFVNQILPQVLACPREMAIDALQSICVDFFKETEIWIDDIVECVLARTAYIELTLPRFSELVRVMAVTVNGTRWSRGDYSHEGHTLILGGTVPQQCEMTIRVVLRPSRYGVNVPTRFLEEYGDIMVQGALAKLKLMNGTGIEWHDPEMAKACLELYNHGKERTRIRVLRNRIGNPIKPTRSWP